MCRGAGKMLRKTSKLDRQMPDGPLPPPDSSPPFPTPAGVLSPCGGPGPGPWVGLLFRKTKPLSVALGTRACST